VPRKKVDQNHTAIVQALRSHSGVSVFSTATLGDGVPDLIVGLDGWTILVEVKVGRKKLNTLQKLWHKAWRGTPVVIMRTVEDAHSLVRDVRTARRVSRDRDLRAEGMYI